MKIDIGADSRGIALCMLAVLLWAGIGIFIKNIEHITPIGITLGRLLLGSLMLLIIILSSTKIRIVFFASKKYLGFYTLIALVMSVHFIFATLGYHYSTVANAALLTNTMPIFVPILASIFLIETVTRRDIIGIVVAFAGIIIIFYAEGLSFSGNYFWGNIAALIAAVLLAIYTIISKTEGQKHQPIIVMFWMCTISAGLIFIGSMLHKQPILDRVIYSDLYNLAGLAIVGTFGHLAYFSCLKHIRATTASSIAMASPVVAMIYASLLISERYSILNLTGISICLIGIIITVTSAKGVKPTST
jgi:drug/metabolite transporter (DMT)-like permease